MTIRTKFVLPDEPGKPSSGDGASVESKYDPMTGVPVPGYKAPSPSARQNAEGGLNTELSDNRNHPQDYRETQAASQGVHGGGAEGLALPTGQRFGTSGKVDEDSNRQSTTVVGAPDKLVTNDTLSKDSNLQAGGRPVA